MSSSVKALAALSARGRRKSAQTQSMTSITSGGKPHTAVNCFFHQSGRRDFVHKSEGDFDDLPGRGKPLELEDDSHVPPELRMAYKVLRNAGCVPPELAERKEISNLADMLEHCEDEQERVRQMQKLRFMILQARMKHQRPLNLDDDTYYDRLLERLSRHDRKK